MEYDEDAQGVNPSTETRDNADVTEERSTPEQRLADAEAALAANRKATEMYDEGFDNEDDFDAWKVLERLRALTKKLRDSPKPATVKVKLNPLSFIEREMLDRTAASRGFPLWG